MFGGLGFMLDGRMAVAAGSRGVLMVRVDPADAEALVAQDGVARCVMRGRELDGWLDVEAGATATTGRLTEWVRVGVDRARALGPEGAAGR